MGTILIVTELKDGSIREASYELAAFAQQIGGDVKSLVIGSGVSGEAESFAKKGGGTVYVADDALPSS